MQKGFYDFHLWSDKFKTTHLSCGQPSGRTGDSICIAALFFTLTSFPNSGSDDTRDFKPTWISGSSYEREQNSERKKKWEQRDEQGKATQEC